jgi:hypothetical protein
MALVQLFGIRERFFTKLRTGLDGMADYSGFIVQKHRELLPWVDSVLRSGDVVDTAKQLMEAPVDYQIKMDAFLNTIIADISIEPYTQTFTITFGDQAENHAKMQIIGKMATSGFTLEDLHRARDWFASKGIVTELHHLNLLAPETVVGTEPAYFLVARGGLRALCDVDAFYQEQAGLEKDTKAFMYGRVVNKKARHNLCFDSVAQEPDYEGKRGRIVAFDSVPLLKLVRSALPDIIGEKADSLVAEGNYYYELDKCGIGWHFHWFKKFLPVGEELKLVLHHGDIYFMSEKTVGTDWKKSSIYTLRHAAGAKKFLEIKEKK